jgi:hypothetical protein
VAPEFIINALLSTSDFSLSLLHHTNSLLDGRPNQPNFSCFLYEDLPIPLEAAGTVSSSTPDYLSTIAHDYDNVILLCPRDLATQIPSEMQ